MPAVAKVCVHVARANDSFWRQGALLHRCSWPPLQLARAAYRLFAHAFRFQTDIRRDITTGLHIASFAFYGWQMPKNTGLLLKTDHLHAFLLLWLFMLKPVLDMIRGTCIPTAKFLGQGSQKLRYLQSADTSCGHVHWDTCGTVWDIFLSSSINFQLILWAIADRPILVFKFILVFIFISFLWNHFYFYIT